MSRPLVRIALLALLPLVLPDCTFFGLGCGPVGGLLQAVDPDSPWCAIFGAECCEDATGDKFGDCGSLEGIFTFPCGVLHDTKCACIENASGAAGQTLVPRAADYAVPPFTFEVTLDFAGMS